MISLLPFIALAMPVFLLILIVMAIYALFLLIQVLNIYIRKNS
jgi:hypothetical protein